MNIHRPRPRLRRATIAIGLLLASLLPAPLSAFKYDAATLFGIDHIQIADAIGASTRHGQYPTDANLIGSKRAYRARLSYSFDRKLQRRVKSLFEHYRPDYAAFVALDPDSGRILVMQSYARNKQWRDNLALRASFPAASVFKLVTAAAALNEGILTPETVIPFNGRSTTLYKKHVLRHRNHKWTRRPTFQEAFAKSINPVFGRVGVYRLGPDRLNDYAYRFGFNRDISSDMSLQTGRAWIPQGDTWAVAEAASGFTRSITLSPLHGAMMAAAAVNGGRLLRPYAVEAAVDETGILLYRPEPEELQRVVAPATARDLRLLMQETVTKGSARRAFRGFFRGRLKHAEVGGKTGTLSGTDPKGRNDWFIGYGQLGERKVAFASLIVNKKKWRVKSTYIARKVLEDYLRPGA